MAGVDPSKISPSNPFEKSGMTASILQAAVSELDPSQAAKWRVAAGGSLSVATLAELNSGVDLSPAAKQDLWEHDHEYVNDAIQHRAQSDAAQLKALEDEADRLRLKRETTQAGGNERVARDRINAQDKKQQAELEARRAAEAHSQKLNQRMAEQRAQADRMAGRFIRP